jgi:hypothetical protein
MSDTIGTACVLAMRAMTFVMMMVVMFSFTMRSAFACLYIVLQAEYLLMVVVRQYRSSQHHHADYH